MTTHLFLACLIGSTIAHTETLLEKPTPATTITLAPFYFVRHGQTDWNIEHRVQGQIDIPLNTTGIAQAHDAAARLRHIPIATIVCSTLSRARQTAEIIASVVQAPVVELEELQEACFGSHQGTIHDNFDYIIEWKKGSTIEGAETYVEFTQRVIAGINRALELPGPVLIVSHGGVHYVVQQTLGINELDVHNCLAIHHMPPEDSEQSWQVSVIENLMATSSSSVDN